MQLVKKCLTALQIQEEEEADKRRRAKCRTEMQPQRGDGRRDGCTGEITPKLIDEGSSKVSLEQQ